MDIKSYLSGYADGEGCFCVSIKVAVAFEMNPSGIRKYSREEIKI
jgi:hypothetical protein